ncbi:hypothetical protein SCB49_06927 [unidentified eubacterium SCB49]|nr:hypothetical protein SCB49_06927 [unidentified eubacterium SCB49]
MKKATVLALFLVSVLACNSNDDDASTPAIESDVTIKFTQSFDDQPVTASEFSNLDYTNENGEQLSISRLRYLMSDIVLTDVNGIDTVISEYQFVDVGESSGALLEAPIKFEEGDYTLSMRFGFSDADNIDAAYPDLNAATWGVPAPLGGGYHYMQMEGVYINSEDVNTNYQFHTIRAAENPGDDVILTDTSIAVNLGTVSVEGLATTIEVNMNIEEWYKNPNLWDLNDLYTMLMPDHEAQIMMNQNGQNVFTLGDITYISE